MGKRLTGFDYSRPMFYMVTIKCRKGVQALCEIVAPGKCQMNAITRAMVNCIRNFHLGCEQIAPIECFSIMPDHIHLLIRIVDRSEKLKDGGAGTAASTSRKSNAPIRLLRLETIVDLLMQALEGRYREVMGLREEVFEAGWHDWIVVAEGQLAAFTRYIRENPRRAFLRAENRRYFTCVRRVAFAEREWFAYGNAAILELPVIEPFRCSRKWEENGAEWREAVGRAERIGPGGAGCGTFMSPCEKACGNAIYQAGGSLIVLSPEGFASRWHPPRNKEALCAQGRMLFLSLWEPCAAKPDNAALYKRCHEMGDIISGAKRLGGNKALKVRGDFARDAGNGMAGNGPIGDAEAGATPEYCSYRRKQMTMQPITKDEALALLHPERRQELRERAHEVTKTCVEKRFDFCSIINARSGRCSENCKWCAQSAHWKTGCETYGWVGTEACVQAAKEAEANGADRIGIVTSGRCLSHDDVENVCAALREMRKATGIGLCASLGLLSKDDLAKLKAAGLQRVHCNIETAPSLFPSLCSTHTMADKLATLHAAKKLGFQICCGGILGMGETDEQLVEFAFTLKEIAPDSIPVNVLHPIDGTPLAHKGILDPERVVDSVALLRLANPSTPLRFAGGRRDMSDETAAKCIYVGMSAGIAGPLLTTPGADFDDDRHLAARAGYAVRAAHPAES